ncbi:MAG: tRNA-intron lyase [Candidatus Woesearchaeota archaeon]
MASKYPIKAELKGSFIVTEDSDAARELYAKSRYGIVSGKKVWLSFYEAVFLYDQGKILIYDSHDKLIKDVHKKLLKNRDSVIKYAVFCDLRKKGYITKTALKFGADFRVYEKGIKPGDDHAKWIVFAVHESDRHTWKDFSAKMRVAHSTKKKLLLGVVDDEKDVTYWEVSWMRP